MIFTYKKKSNFFPGWIYNFLSFMNKHIYPMDLKFYYFQCDLLDKN